VTRRRPRLRVAIEARAFEHDRPRSTGIGHWLAGVLRALGELDGDDRYTVLTTQTATAEVAPLAAGNVRFRRIPLPRRVFASLQRRDRVPPLDLFAPRADVFLFPNFTTLPLWRAPFSVVIHDLSFLLVPDTLNDAYRERLARQVPDTVRRAGSVIAPSASVKVDLVEHLAVPPDKIIVASPGVDRRVFRPVGGDARAEVLMRHSLPTSYFLFVGTLQPRKNVVRVLTAYRALPADVRSRHALVLVGMKGWRDDEIASEITRLTDAGERVHYAGYADGADLPALYSGATAFVWPSLFEGFGMPVLEAMACGTPVITSDRSSLPEAAGGAALLVDPFDVDAIADAMRRVADDDALASSLVERGHERAARACWHDTASHVRDALALAATSG